MMLQLIGVACGFGARDRGCHYGPHALVEGKLVEQLAGYGLAAQWRAQLQALPGNTQASPLDMVTQVNQLLAQHTEDCVRNNMPFCVIGGDHSCAIGTWSGVHNALGDRRLGLLWIDAHLDSHLPETSPSGALHGMPVATLLGCGHSALVRLARAGAALHPESLRLVGVRSHEAEERLLLSHLGVRWYEMAEVRQQGLSALIKAILTTLLYQADCFGISLDMDGIDPSQAPGVGTPEPDGLDAQELIAALAPWQHHPKFVGLEIAEFNPLRDSNHQTRRLITTLISHCAPVR